MSRAHVAFLVFLAVAGVSGNVLLHNPRGSNNRLHESTRGAQNHKRLFDSQNDAGGYNQGEMHYYSGSTLNVEWSISQGCGGDVNNCQVILQYMCEADVRDGTLGGTIPEAGNDLSFGRHESASSYAACAARERNKGLWVPRNWNNGDNRNSALSTRQNDGRERRYGLECPEERDYYPYWAPSTWRDIAVLTSNSARCEYYRSESQNIKPRSGAPMHDIRPPACLSVVPAPANHHQMMRYEWTMPETTNAQSCVLRVRYNVSSLDRFPTWDTDSRSNCVSGGTFGPCNLDAADVWRLEDEPSITLGHGFSAQLASRTQNYGRTYQDRSHIWTLEPRPSDVTPTETIYNLNVGGQRGSHVEAFPAMTYAFTPQRLSVSFGDYIHRQVTGTNSSVAGEGLADRTNFVEIRDNNLRRNMPQNASDWLSVENADSPAGLALIKRLTLLDQLNPVLNNAKPWFDFGIMAYSSERVIAFMNTRTNSFGFNQQKGSIVVCPACPAGQYRPCRSSRADVTCVELGECISDSVTVTCIPPYPPLPPPAKKAASAAMLLTPLQIIVVAASSLLLVALGALTVQQWRNRNVEVAAVDTRGGATAEAAPYAAATVDTPATVVESFSSSMFDGTSSSD